MNSMTIVTVAVLLCLVTLKSACALQCVYFPRTFLSHLEISNATINQQRCSSLENITNSWNDFLGTQINFLLLQQCVVLNGTDLTASSSCITEIKKTFQPLFNSPLCRNTVPPTDSWACIFDPLDPCLKSEQAGPTGNVLSLLCKLKSLGKHWLSGLKGTLKSMGLDQKQLLFYTSGLYANVHGLRGTVHKSTNKDTYNFIGNLLCSKVPDGNCCNGPDGCNLPKHLSQTSFYATVGVREIMNAYTNDVYLRDYLASAAGVHHIRHPADHRGSDSLGRIGSPDRHTDNQGSSLLANKGIVAAMLGALAFACLALLICLIGVCYVQQRKRRCQKSDEPESLLKSESPHAQHQRKQQQQQHHHNHHHDNSGAAEKLLSSSTSSSSAFNICPAPSAAVGIAAIGIGSHSYIDAAIAPANNLHQQQQRMFAVPNRSGASAMAVACGSSSGVGTGDSLPSTSNNDRQQQQQQQQQQNSSGEGALAFGDSQTGSGSGQPILLPRTVAREIEHRESIGQGRFGQVYRSEWRNDPVAVKIFSSRAESSWSTEGHMYELPGMRHDAILGFIAIDNIDIGLETQLWLITDYHANGSLQSYLTRCSVDQHTMSRMLHSIASGLAHLHSEISGVKCKPAIAHRDIKSNNILVKADLSCCIADFGLAVALQPGFGVVVGFGSGGLVGVGCSDSGIGETNNNNNGRVGTRRYLSPECLNGSQDSRDFTALRKADIYATGLVFWELAVRCHDPIRGVTSEPEYQQPYQDLVPNNPTLEEMQQVVCPPANVRPPLSPAWQNHPVLERLCRVLTECWYQSPAARLEAMSVKDQTARMLHTSNELLAADKEVLGTVVA